MTLHDLLLTFVLYILFHPYHFVLFITDLVINLKQYKASQFSKQDNCLGFMSFQNQHLAFEDNNWPILALNLK